jgi:uncharacterized protein
MDWILSIPALVKVLTVFGIIVAANGIGLHLGLAALLGAVLIAFWNGLLPAEMAILVARSAVSPDTILLALLLGGILGLSSVMKQTGAMDDVVRSYRNLIRSPRITMATLPGLIGVLPMPGGAVFSAPMVEALDDDGRLSPDERSAVNFWFRHTIELVWPLYPAFILTSAISGLSFGTIIALNAYAPFVLLGGGMFFLLRRYGPWPLSSSAVRKPFLKVFIAFLGTFAPVLLVLAVSAVLDFGWKLAVPSILAAFPSFPAGSVGRYGPVLVGVVFGVALLVKTRGPVNLRSNFLTAGSVGMIGTIVGIKVFSAVLDGTGVAEAVTKDLANMGIPGTFVVALLPFLAGLVTGVGFGCIGLSFPISIALIPLGTPPLAYGANVALAGAFGFAGMMLSPLHVCMVVTAEHFGTKLAETIKRIGLPLLVFLAVAVCYYFILVAIA